MRRARARRRPGARATTGGIAPALRGVAMTIGGIAPALRGVAMTIGGIAPALRGVAMTIGGIAPALRGVAMSIVRAVTCALLVLVLGGPTPGAIGSCGGDELGGEADLESYCTEREQLVCVRQALRREITTGERDDCRRQAIVDCMNRSWAPRCRPTERQTRACLNALSSTDTLHTPEDELEECQTEALCNATPRGEAGAGEEP